MSLGLCHVFLCARVFLYEHMRVWLFSRMFFQENQMLTPKMSLRRNNVLKTYSEQVEAMYAGKLGVHMPKIAHESNEAWTPVRRGEKRCIGRVQRSGLLLWYWRNVDMKTESVLKSCVGLCCVVLGLWLLCMTTITLYLLHGLSI